MRQDIKRGLMYYWLFQLGIVAVLSMIFSYISGNKGMMSVLMAGAVFMVPNVIFARGVFKHQGAQKAQKIVNSFYRAEGFKLMLSSALFVVVFVTVKLEAFVFFVSYIVLVCSQWLAHLFLVKKNQQGVSAGK